MEGICSRTSRQKFKGADVVFGNLEGPLLDGGTTAKCAGRETSGTCYAFRMPTRYVDHLVKAGFNVVSTANNHAFDFGAEGERNTRTSLQNAFIQPAGGRSIARFSKREESGRGWFLLLAPGATVPLGP